MPAVRPGKSFPAERRRHQMIATKIVRKGIAALGLAVMATLAVIDMASAQGGNIYQATLAEPNQKTQEVSTEQVRRILSDGSAIILDTRKRSEYVAGHIPGARNVDATSPASVAAVERLVSGDKNKALVLYCNGPFCQASRQLGEQLVAAGFSQCAAIPARYPNLACTRRADRGRVGRDTADLQGRPDGRVLRCPIRRGICEG